MSLRLHVGLSKKVGQPAYGSLGASCGLEVELDGSLLESDLDRFHQYARRAYVACAQAVNDELARHQATAVLGNGHSKCNGDGNGQQEQLASVKQLEYAKQLADQIEELGVGRLESLTGQMFGVPLAKLSRLDASGLIDALKAIKAGTTDVETAFSGAASL